MGDQQNWGLNNREDFQPTISHWATPSLWCSAPRSGTGLPLHVGPRGQLIVGSFLGPVGGVGPHHRLHGGSTQGPGRARCGIGEKDLTDLELLGCR